MITEDVAATWSFTALIPTCMRNSTSWNRQDYDQIMMSLVLQLQQTGDESYATFAVEENGIFDSLQSSI